jgi:hypothetical protein
MTGTTLCRSATVTNCYTGANPYTISAIGAPAVVAATGTEQFGMCASVAGSTALAVSSPYIDTVNGCTSLGADGVYTGNSTFGFNDAGPTGTGGTNTAGGSTVLTSTGAVPLYTGSFSFLGDISAVTPAGVYTTSLNFVATGTF